MSYFVDRNDSQAPLFGEWWQTYPALVQSRSIFTAREIGRKMRGVFNAA